MPRMRTCFYSSRAESRSAVSALLSYEDHGGALHACYPIKEISNLRKFRGRGDGVTDLDGLFHYEFAVFHAPLRRQFSVRALEFLGRWNFIGLKAGWDLNVDGIAAQRSRDADGSGSLARAEEIFVRIRKQARADQQ